LKNKRVQGNSLLEAVCRSVHERREQLGISQEELAHRAGLHRTYISDIERRARNPSLKTLSRLATALEMTASELIKLGESKCAAQAGAGGFCAEPSSSRLDANGVLTG
jgi:transcriptional regulator with XRE-family HTH domain